MNAPPEVKAAYMAATDRQRALALNLAKGMFKADAMLAAGYAKGQAKKCLKSVVDAPVVLTLKNWYASQAIAKEIDKVELVVEKMTGIALFDARDIHDSEGRVLPVDQWPESARCAFAGWDSMGRPKLWSPMDAAEKVFKVKGVMAPDKLEVNLVTSFKIAPLE